MRGLFVTATDTGVGKSVLSAALLAAMRAAGLAVAAYKPALTGTDEAPAGEWPPDDELLALAAGGDPKRIAPLRFAPAVSPHLAAALAGVEIDPGALRAGARSRAPGEAGALVVEGVGGLLVPLADGWDVRRYARELGLPLVIVARTGLGTINHTLLTIEAAHSADLPVAAVVLTPWPATPTAVETSNRATLERLSGIPVAVLPRAASLAAADLAAAAASLPYADWLAAQ